MSQPPDRPEDERTEGMTEGPFGSGNSPRDRLPRTDAFESPPEGSRPPTAATYRAEQGPSITDALGARPTRISPAPGPIEEPSSSEAEIQVPAGFSGRPEPGQVLFGRYLVERQIGEGGMGTVWLVRHLELDAPRALKLVVPGAAFIPEAQARFRREARAMARLSHPNAVVVHDARISRDAAFIEMEYVRGQSLNRLMTPGVPMPLDWVARIVVQLCDVLQEAHEQKIVHRDLKPSNLMLVDGRPPGREQLKVLDFGIAKILEADLEGGDVHTHTGSFMGTAQYSSPEQIRGAGVDARSDLYSVGIMLYEFLTGHRPFLGPMTNQLYDHLHTSPPPFSDRNPAARAPAEVERVVLRCLAKDPADRPQSAHEMADEFLRAVPPGVVDALPARPYLAPQAPATQEPPRTESPFWPHDPADPSPSQAADTFDDYRVPYQPVSLPRTEGPVSWGHGQPLPQGDAGRGAAVLDRPSPPALETIPPGGKAVTTPPTGGLLRAAFVVVPVVLALALAAWFLVPPRRTSPRLPDGYQAIDARDVVSGSPRGLVRQSDGTRFHLIEGGSFTMGALDEGSSEDRPPHPVALSSYYMQETEVTNGEMEAYFTARRITVADRPKRWKAAREAIEKAGLDPKCYPAVGIPHALAEQFAEWAGGRLPSEAQWEYAARSRGKAYPYVWGVDAKRALKLANIDSIGLIGEIPTREVGKYPDDRSEQGILDLTGNVREWCRDHWSNYTASTEPQRDPVVTGGSEGTPLDFVIRGGSFRTFADVFRTTRPRRAERDEETGRELAEDGAAIDLGFRIVIEWPPRR